MLPAKWLFMLATLSVLVFNNRCSATFFMSIDGGGRGYGMPGYGFGQSYGSYGYPHGYDYGYPYGQSYSYGNSPYFVGRESLRSANEQGKVVGPTNPTGGCSMRPFQGTSNPGSTQGYSQPYRYISDSPVTPPKNMALSGNAQVPAYSQSQMMNRPPKVEAGASLLGSTGPIASPYPNTYTASTDEIDGQDRMIGSTNPSGYSMANPNPGAERFYSGPQQYYRYVSYSPESPSKTMGTATGSAIPPYRYQITDGQQKDPPILGMTGPIVSPYPKTNQAYVEEYEDQGGMLTSINPSGYVMTSYQTPPNPGIVQYYSQPRQSYRYTSYSVPPTGMSTGSAIPLHNVMEGQAKEENTVRGQGRPIVSPYPKTNADAIVGAVHGYGSHHYGNHHFNSGFLAPKPHGGLVYANLHNHHANSGHLYGARHYYG